MGRKDWYFTLVILGQRGCRRSTSVWCGKREVAHVSLTVIFPQPTLLWKLSRELRLCGLIYCTVWQLCVTFCGSSRFGRCLNFRKYSGFDVFGQFSLLRMGPSRLFKCQFGDCAKYEVFSVGNYLYFFFRFLLIEKFRSLINVNCRFLQLFVDEESNVSLVR